MPQKGFSGQRKSVMSEDVRSYLENGKLNKASISTRELQSTIPDKKVGTASKFSPPPTFNVDTRVIFYLFVGKNAIFSNIDEGGWGIRDPTQVSQLLLAGIV